ncbi:MAG: class I SAM-dependent methyltransferase [Oscillospiraceae bacterium]|jgi:SAM-dependent methyltransferase|nr:class I SAM-dependent methyltransferase [Oscillospiraceae bacterium]
MSDKPYYLAYEKRYQAVFAAGIPRWGHADDDSALNEALADWVKANGLVGKRVIEYACGEGAAGVILSRLGCVYCGVDIAPSAVQKATEALADYPNATVRQLDMVNERVSGQFDAALDVMGLHMLVTDDDRAKYLANVAAALKPNAPALFFRENYRADAPSCTIHTLEEWLRVTGDDYATPQLREALVDGVKHTVSIPLVPARAKNRADYIAEMEAAGFQVDRFVEMESSRAIIHSASVYVRKG